MENSGKYQHMLQKQHQTVVLPTEYYITKHRKTEQLQTNAG